MIDPAHVVVGVQAIPTPRLIGVDGRTERDALADCRDGVSFLPVHERKRAPIVFAHDNHDLPLAGLFFGQAAVNALVGLVLRLHMTAEIGAVDCVFAAFKFRLALFGLDCFPEFVSENKGRLVLTIQIAAQLKRAMPLGAVREDRDGEQVVTDRPLAVGEDCPGRD